MRLDQFLRKSAWEFIIAQGIDTLPVDVVSLIKQNNYLLYTYTEIAAEANKTFDEIKQKYGADGFTFWSGKYDNFIIAYNEYQPPKRIRWTLMHELGHIALNHISKPLPVMSRHAAENYKQLEREANGFARRILCPSIVLHEVNVYEVEQIAELCDISKQAATYRSGYMKQLRERNKFLIDKLEKAVLLQFEQFINENKTKKGV